MNYKVLNYILIFYNENNNINLWLLDRSANAHGFAHAELVIYRKCIFTLSLSLH